jgi:hypothetical protein
LRLWKKNEKETKKLSTMSTLTQLIPSFSLFGFAGVWLTQSFWASIGIAAVIVSERTRPRRKLT